MQTQNTQNEKDKKQEKKTNPVLESALGRVYSKDVEKLVSIRKGKLKKGLSYVIKTEKVKKKKKVKPIPPAAYILAVVFVGVGVFSYLLSLALTSEPEQEVYFKGPATPEFLVVDKTVYLDADKPDRSFILLLTSAALKKYPPGTLVEFVPLINDEKISIQKLFEKFGIKFAEKYKNAFSDYRLGIFEGKSGYSPFIILKTPFFAEGLSALRSVEFDLALSLAPFFPLKGNPVKLFSSDLEFERTTIENSVVNVLRDREANIYILYGVIDKNTIVLTSSIEAFSEIARRLRIIK